MATLPENLVYDVQQFTFEDAKLHKLQKLLAELIHLQQVRG